MHAWLDPMLQPPKRLTSAARSSSPGRPCAEALSVRCSKPRSTPSLPLPPTKQTSRSAFAGASFRRTPRVLSAQGSTAHSPAKAGGVVRGSREPSGGCAAGPLRMVRAGVAGGMDRLPAGCAAYAFGVRCTGGSFERSARFAVRLSGVRLSRCPGRVVRPSRPCAGPSCSRPVVLAARSRRRPRSVPGRSSSDTGAR